MMQYLAIPFVGAFIGWLTNIIAIEMLFKPKTSIIFFGFQVPFTPGLIPANRNKILKVTARRIVSVFKDTLYIKKENSYQYEFFNKVLDNYWASYVFLTPQKRKKLYDSIVKALMNQTQTENMESIIFNQLQKYNISELEATVRALSHHSLKGIKIIGAASGFIVGLITLLIRNI